MSIKAIGWVWEHSQSEGAARITILAIADCVGTGGDAWPSMAELCRKTRLSERGVQKAVRRLVEIGELEVSKNCGRGRTNRYRVLMQTPHDVRGFEDGNPEQSAPPEQGNPEQGSPQTPNVVRETPNVVRETPNVVRPEPSEPSEPSREPTERGARVPAPRTGDGLTEIPPEFAPTDAMLRWATATFGSRIDPHFETQQFVSYYLSTGTRRRSWPDAWMKWLRDSDRRAAQRPASAPPGRRSTTDERIANAQALKALYDNGQRPNLSVIRGEITR